MRHSPDTPTAVVIDNDMVAGAERHAARLVKALRDAGRDRTHLIVSRGLFEQMTAFAEQRTILQELERDGRLAVIDEHKGGARALTLARRNRDVWRYARAEGIKLFHTVLSGHGYALFALIASGPRVVFEVSSPDVVDKILAGTMTLSRTLERVDLFHAVSPSVQRRLQEGLAANGKHHVAAKVRCNPVPFYRPSPKRDDVPKEKRVTYASRFVSRKNPVLFARAARDFLTSHPDWKVSVLGKGSSEEDLTSEIECELVREIASGQAYVGFSHDLDRELARSSIFASTIQPDNYPSQSILEAMDAGNAIVATNGGDSSLLATPANGILVEYDAESITQALRTLADDPSRLRSCGAASREIVRTQFGPANYLRGLTSVYDEALT